MKIKLSDQAVRRIAQEVVGEEGDQQNKETIQDRYAVAIKWFSSDYAKEFSQLCKEAGLSLRVREAEDILYSALYSYLNP